MNPINKSGNDTPTRVISSNEVGWQGPVDVQGYNFYKGISLTDLFMQQVNKLKDLYSYTDISDVDFTSLTNINPTNLKQALALLITAIEELQEEPEDVQTAAADKIFTVTYNCLVNNQGIQEFTSNDQIIQAIINKACATANDLVLTKNQVDGLSQTTTQLQSAVEVVLLQINQLQNWSTKDLRSAEVTDVETFFTELRDDIYAKETSIGTISDFDNARTITGDPVLVMAEYGTNPAYTMNPSNAAMYLKNLGVVTYDLLERVKNIELNFSTASCSDIKINFTAEFNSDRTLLTIKLNNSTGTYIPDSFIDNGSYITITDINNHTYTKDIVLTNNFIDVINLVDAGLDILVDYNVTIFHAFKNTVNARECANLATKFLTYENNTNLVNINTSGSGTGYIEYYSPSSNTFVNFNVAANATYQIPENASILMILKTTDLVLSSFNANINTQLGTALPQVSYTFSIRVLTDGDGNSFYSDILDKYHIYKFDLDFSDIEIFVTPTNFLKPDASPYSPIELGVLISNINSSIPRHLGEITDMEIRQEVEGGFSITYVDLALTAPLLPVPPSLGLKIRNAGSVPGCTACYQDPNTSVWINAKLN